MSGRAVIRSHPRRGPRLGRIRPVFGRSASVAVLLLAAAACQDPLGPDDFAGVYLLDAVAGDPLPAVLIEHDSFRFHVHSDELILNPDRTGRRLTTGLADLMDGEGPSQDVRWETELVFRVVGQRIEVEFVCPPNALMLCTPPPHLIGRRTPGGLRVESAQGERVPLSYVSAPVLAR